jgi:polyisoprenoid-binding protein YceI
MIKRLLVTVLASSLAAVTLGAAPSNWKADAAHTSVGFKIRHFFAKVPGSFSGIQAALVFDPENPAANSVEATIPVASINTANERRDRHLKTDDFFSVEKYPNVTFKSTSWTKTGQDTYDVVGDLTIKDITKTVTLKAKFLGSGPGPRGGQVSGWEVRTTINRHEFGVSYANPALGDDVDIEIEFEATSA